MITLYTAWGWAEKHPSVLGSQRRIIQSTWWWMGKSFTVKICVLLKMTLVSPNAPLNADTQPLSKTHVFQGPSRECSVLLIIYRWCWMCTKCWCPLLRCRTLDFPWLWVCSRMNKPLPKLIILFIWLCKGTMEIHRLQGCRPIICFHKTAYNKLSFSGLELNPKFYEAHS